MKVDANEVKKLHVALDHIVVGIIETARCGDDGFIGAMEDQLAEYRQAVKEFEVMTIDINLPQNKPKKQYMMYDGSAPATGSAQADTFIIFKASLYNAIKRELKDDRTKDYAGLHAYNLFSFIEELIHERNIVVSRHWREFEHSIFEVIQDVADEIVEHRQKTPQQSLFK